MLVVLLREFCNGSRDGIGEKVGLKGMREFKVIAEVFVVRQINKRAFWKILNEVKSHYKKSNAHRLF